MTILQPNTTTKCNPVANVQQKFEIVGMHLDDPDFNQYDKRVLFKLLMAKELFSHELPRMPKDYITRLVFNPNHDTACLFEHPVPKGASPLVGGICFRKFPEVKLIEIAFCAVSGSRKFVGYGSLIMNLLKEHVKKLGYTDICTYADNTAIDYFQKQGFSRRISIPEAIWLGRLKHYDGAIFVQCPLYGAVDYLQCKDIIRKQRAALLKMIGITASPGTTPLDQIPSMGFARQFATEEPKTADAAEVKRCSDAAVYAVLIEAGKTYAIPFLQTCEQLDWQPNIVPNDLQNMLGKAQSGFYRSQGLFKEHAKSILERCQTYNGESSEICKAAQRLYDGLVMNFDRAYAEQLTPKNAVDQFQILEEVQKQADPEVVKKAFE